MVIHTAHPSSGKRVIPTEASAVKCLHDSPAWSVVVIRPYQCAGMNRHEAEEEESSRERSSDPLGPEFCASPIVR
jgi:hypothetical protein